ncbi:MAG: plastocyanin/azurin family copper-binding protein [Actinomycetota bacterium]|jgi:plastocyanin
MSGRLRRVGVALVLVTVMLPRPAEAYVSRVDVSGMRFTPPRVEIELGDSVIWEAGEDGHTVTARDGSFDSSSRGLMREGDQYRWRFRQPGTYAYFCRVHQNQGMQGEVVVVDPYAPTTSSTRLMPVTAPATTATTAAPPPPTVSTAPPTTTTSRPLATSSSTSPAIATSTTVPVGTPVVPQEPPPLDPAAPVVGSAEADADLPEAQAAARRTAAEDDVLPLIALGTVIVLALFGGVMGLRARRSRAG